MYSVDLLTRSSSSAGTVRLTVMALTNERVFPTGESISCFWASAEERRSPAGSWKYTNSMCGRGVAEGT